MAVPLEDTKLDDKMMVEPKRQGWMQAEGESSVVNTLRNCCLTLYGETEEGKTLIHCLWNKHETQIMNLVYL